MSDIDESDQRLMAMEYAQKSFRQELECLINRYSVENASDTPDFILANYLCACLDAFNQTVRRREEWYGRPCGNGAAILGPANADGARTLPSDPIGADGA